MRHWQTARQRVEDGGVLEPRTRPEPGEEDESVEEGLERVDRVDVGGQPPGRLGPPEAQKLLDRESSERIGLGSVRLEQRSGHGAKDAEGERVVLDVQVPVAFGVPIEQPFWLVADSVHPRPLCADPHVGEPLVEEHRGVAGLIDIESGRDVDPFDEERAVESNGVDRTSHHRRGS